MGKRWETQGRATMSKPSLRQIAKELDISPAYLSYMVNGKRPWRKELYQRYVGVVNTFVNSGAEVVNRKIETPPVRVASLPKFETKLSGGSARESNPPTPLVTRHNGFEVRKSHRAPSTPPFRKRRTRWPVLCRSRSLARLWVELPRSGVPAGRL